MSGSAEEAVAQLLVAVGRGERQAFAELFRACGPKLLPICSRLLGRRDVAEEVLQEAFVRIWQKAAMYESGRGSAMGWLIAVTRRCALDRLRQYKEEELSARRVDTAADAELVLQSSDAFPHDIRRCMDRLGTNEQRAIALAFWYGMTHSELADRLGAPLGTVKSWIRRGLVRFKECLEP
jgi:RNA polymerase sigma-70 factor (ECF subfamily)